MDLETSCHKRKIFEKEARWVMKYIKEKQKMSKKWKGNEMRTPISITSASQQCKYFCEKMYPFMKVQILSVVTKDNVGLSMIM